MTVSSSLHKSRSDHFETIVLFSQIVHSAQSCTVIFCTTHNCYCCDFHSVHNCNFQQICSAPVLNLVKYILQTSPACNSNLIHWTKLIQIILRRGVVFVNDRSENLQNFIQFGARWLPLSRIAITKYEKAIDEGKA